MVCFPSQARDSFLLQSTQSGCGAYLAFYSVGTWSHVPGGKVAGGQGEVSHTPKSTDEVKSEAVLPLSHMPSWCTPLPFPAKQNCMYSTATMGHVLSIICNIISNIGLCKVLKRKKLVKVSFMVQ